GRCSAGAGCRAAARRHGGILDSARSGRPAPNRASRNLISEVWSNSCELTQPPLLHGETTIIGTRTPRPYGPAGWLASPGKISLVVGTVDRPCARVWGGVGGTRWSKKPPSSS